MESQMKVLQPTVFLRHFIQWINGCFMSVFISVYILGIIGLLENSSNISEFDVCGCFAVTNSLLSELEWRFSHENGRQTRIKLFLGGILFIHV